MHALARVALPAAAAAALSACSAPPPEPDPRLPRAVHELETREVRAGGRTVGRLVRMRIDHPRAAPFWQVRDAEGRWLGYVDDQGRVWQRVPFAMTEVFRGVHPMEKALALLYERPGPFELVPPATAPVEASGPRAEQPPRQQR